MVWNSQIQVHKRLKLTLELVKKEMEISKIQVLLVDNWSIQEQLDFYYVYLILSVVGAIRNL